MAAQTGRAEAGFVRVFGAGQAVFRKGDPAAGMYLVLQGRVHVAVGPRGPDVLYAGDVIEEEGLA
ncbi:MAG: cyclic nucleotide-binding domain-containing protein, partial [Desulfotomaculales bacterium]